MAPENLLEIRDLRVAFTSEGTTSEAVKGVSFNVPTGKTVGVVGESGSGKSVTALSILRLLPEPPGEIVGGEIWFRSPERGPLDLLQLKPQKPPLVQRWRKRPVNPLTRIRGREIAMVFQEPTTALNPVFTVGRQVMEGLILHQELSRQAARKRTQALFEEVELPRAAQLLNSYPHELSGGQKQRVMIAMALACNPALLIADEPTTALDVTVQKTILTLLERLRLTHQMSMVFISHDLGVIAEIADEVVVMYQGEVVEQGPIARIFEAPHHPYTQGLLACRPPLAGNVHRLPTLDDFLHHRPPQPSPAVSRQKIDFSAEPLLTVENLRVEFPSRGGNWRRKAEPVVAVDEVSFEILPGETLGLVGESGSGKTTTGRAVLRLLAPTAGQVRFLGQDLATLSAKALRSLRREMQIVFQDPYGSLNPRMPIGRAIQEPMEVHGLHEKSGRRPAVETLLERVGLSAAHYNRYPHEFSGGQRQRISIARALAVNPRFLVLDESVSALDVSVQAQVLNLLRDLQDERQLTYLFISHDLSVVRFMANRVLVMQNGRLVEQDETERIFSAPQHPYTQKLLAAIPRGSRAAIQAAQERRALQATNP